MPKYGKYHDVLYNQESIISKLYSNNITRKNCYKILNLVSSPCNPSAPLISDGLFEFGEKEDTFIDFWNEILKASQIRVEMVDIAYFLKIY